MASGQTLLTPMAAEFQKLQSGDADPIVRNTIPAFAFDAGDTLLLTRKMPMAYSNATGLDFIIHGLCATATSGNVVLGVRLKRLTGGDVDTETFATQKTVTVTGVPAGSAGTDFTGTVQFGTSEIDGIVGGDIFQLEIQLVSSGTTISGQWAFTGLEIRDR